MAHGPANNVSARVFRDDSGDAKSLNLVDDKAARCGHSYKKRAWMSDGTTATRKTRSKREKRKMKERAKEAPMCNRQ